MLRNVARKSTVLVVLVIAALLLLGPMQPVKAIPEKTASIQRDSSLVSDQALVNYEEFSRLTLLKRKLIYSNLSPEVQSELWRAQLWRYLVSEDLTLEQRTVLLEALQFASPLLFASNKDRKQSTYRRNIRKLKNLEIRALKAFGFEKVGRIFTELGSIDGNLQVLAEDGSGGEHPNCACARESDYCGSSSHCSSGPTLCLVVASDCGTFWAYDCDGLCYTNS
jgi:hypothetical protein